MIIDLSPIGIAAKANVVWFLYKPLEDGISLVDYTICLDEYAIHSHEVDKTASNKIENYIIPILEKQHESYLTTSTSVATNQLTTIKE